MKKLEAIGSSARRNALRTLAVGAVVEASSLLPSRWTKPVVDTVVLPVHAQMSPGAGLMCNAGSLTVDNTVQDGDAQGHVGIIYDGASNCSLIQVFTEDAEGGASGDPDEMLLIDGDGDPVTDFDLRGPNYGANWGPGPDTDNNLAGSYSFDIQRAAPPNSGTTFRVEFDVSFSGSEMTVANVQITAL